MAAGPSRAGGRLLERRDVELDHGQHLGDDALAHRAVLARRQLGQPGGDDLPRHSVLVLEPAALRTEAAVGGQPVPDPVELVLGVDVDLDGGGLGLREVRPAVESDELLVAEAEVDLEDAALLAVFARCVGVVRDPGDLLVGDEARVGRGGVVTVGVEPETGTDLGGAHAESPSHLSRSLTDQVCPRQPMEYTLRG